MQPFPISGLGTDAADGLKPGWADFWESEPLLSQISVIASFQSSSLGQNLVLAIWVHMFIYFV